MIEQQDRIEPSAFAAVRIAGVSAGVEASHRARLRQRPASRKERAAYRLDERHGWIPASAGMTNKCTLNEFFSVTPAQVRGPSASCIRACAEAPPKCLLRLQHQSKPQTRFASEVAFRIVKNTEVFVEAYRDVFTAILKAISGAKHVP
jgi:hypothetical protein